MEDTPPVGPPPPPHHGPSRRRWGWRLAQWAGELLTVFVGVYAAFTLNAYQAHRQDRQRRAQILDWAQGIYSDIRVSAVQSEAQLRKAKAENERSTAAGEMPPLHVSTFVSDHDPSDFTSMLQSGGFGLLEIETVRDMRAVEGSIRQLLLLARHDQQLSDALLLPNLGNPPAFFYDPATRQLRPTYAWYAKDTAAILDEIITMHQAVDKALARLRIERERNR